MGRSRRLVGLLAVGLLLGGLDFPAHGAAAARQDAVDLYLIRGSAALIPGGAVDQAMTVLNNGRDMAAEIELFYITPIFVRPDQGKPLPDGCSIYYQNADIHIPQIVKCVLPPLKSGQTHELSLPLAIAEGAPPVVTYGTAIARPARPDLDPERNLLDNLATPGGTIALGGMGVRADGPVLAVQSTTTIVSATAAAGDYRVRNLGNADAENARLIVVNPLLVNSSAAGDLPPACSMVLSDPTVPEIVQCSLDTLQPGQTKELRIPVKAAPGAPAGRLTGAIIAYTDRVSSVGPVDSLLEAGS